MGAVVEVTVNRQADDTAQVKLQSEAWELNVYASFAELRRLRTIEDTSWSDRRSLAIGTSAGAQVFWCEQDRQVTILVGHDDESWDVAVIVSLATVEDVLSLAEREIGAP
jgi:hypothetical protein